MSEQPSEPVAFPTVQSNETGERTQVWPWYTTALVWTGLVALLVPVSILATHPTVFGLVGEPVDIFEDMPAGGVYISVVGVVVALAAGWREARQHGADASWMGLALSLFVIPIVSLGAGYIVILLPFVVGLPPLGEVPAVFLIAYPVVALLSLFGGARLVGPRVRKRFLVPAGAALSASLILLPATLPTLRGYSLWMPKLSFIPILVGLVAPRSFGLEAGPPFEDTSLRRFFAGWFLFAVGTTIVMSFAGLAGLALVG